MRNRSVLQSGVEEALATSSEPWRHTIFVGGFPCQDLSIAGKKAGRKGARSGLYRDYLAVICAERPTWVVTENVGHTWRRWVPHLRRSLHRIGYASLPLRVRASDVGAPHERTRIFLVAHADGELLRELSRWWVREGRQMADEFADYGSEQQVANTAGIGWDQEHPDSRWSSEGNSTERNNGSGSALSSLAPMANTDSQRLEVGQSVASNTCSQLSSAVGKGWWVTEPDVGRVAHGVPARVDRLTALGNAIVPQIAQIIAAGIKEIEKLKRGKGEIQKETSGD